MPCVRFFKGPEYLCHELQRTTGFVLGSKKRKETCFLTKIKVLLLSSTHRNTRNVPSKYLKCLIISEGVLYFTAYCGLLEHLNLKSRRKQ